MGYCFVLSKQEPFEHMIYDMRSVFFLVPDTHSDANKATGLWAVLMWLCMLLFVITIKPLFLAIGKISRNQKSLNVVRIITIYFWCNSHQSRNGGERTLAVARFCQLMSGWLVGSISRNMIAWNVGNRVSHTCTINCYNERSYTCNTFYRATKCESKHIVMYTVHNDQLTQASSSQITYTQYAHAWKRKSHCRRCVKVNEWRAVCS